MHQEQDALRHPYVVQFHNPEVRPSVRANRFLADEDNMNMEVKGDCMPSARADAGLLLQSSSLVAQSRARPCSWHLYRSWN